MKVSDLPEHGRVVIGHPKDEPHTRLLAEREECDYMLSIFIPLDKFYVLNLDEFFKDIPPCPPSR